jgi:HAD superfamily hydrolase (TIGR01509 family)
VPFPGLVEELERWKGLPVGLATSGARAEALLMLDIMGVRGVFDVIVAYEDVPRPKPAPDSYLRAAELLGFPPAACAAVEDSPRGLTAAIAAGAFALAVLPVSLSPLPGGAVRGFSSTVEALTWLRE